MDGYGLFFAMLLEGVAGGCSPTCGGVRLGRGAPRTLRAGRGAEAGDTPDVDATAAFIAGLGTPGARGQRAIGGRTWRWWRSLSPDLPPPLQAVGLRGAGLAFFGRALVIAVLGPREALDNRAPGPRRPTAGSAAWATLRVGAAVGAHPPCCT